MLILASASPRRRDLLLAAGIPHVVRPSHIPEERKPGERAEEFVQRLAAEKAAAVTASRDDVVLGADTVVCLAADVLGKPRDAADARRMLKSLSGKQHRVVTGVALRRGTRTLIDYAETRVWFGEWSNKEIDDYIESGEPLDKAGAYAIQGYASRFIHKIDGSYHNVVGLPVSLVYRHLKEL